MRAVVTVIGKDKVGIIAGISAALAENDINILDISQTIMQGFFTMVMMVDLENSKFPLAVLSEKFSKLGNDMGIEVRLQHEEIFNSMQRI